MSSQPSSTPAPQPGARVDLDDIMLAMDVVDTLRHQQAVVDRELASDQQDQVLIEKVKRMYAAQGIAVSDETVAAGVAALRENRFTYRPPKPGSSLWLAKLYVQRGKWAKRLGLLVAILVVLGLGYRWFFVAPAQRRLKQSATVMASAMRQQNDRLKTTVVKFQGLQKSLAALRKSPSEEPAAGTTMLLDEAANHLAKALQGFKSLEQLPPADTLKDDDDQVRIKERQRRLDQRDQVLDGIDTSLTRTESALDTMGKLRNLPAKLDSLLGQIGVEAREEAALEQARNLHRQGKAAVAQADLKGVQTAQAGLQSLYENLIESYELRIVSRPGVSSGVWRYPDNNQGTRNYYLIVEALTPQGRRLTLPITNEENGRTERVSLWGLRVDQSVFERVARDKKDDGIIQNARMGSKRRGYLTPQYLIPTRGGAITKW